MRAEGLHEGRGEGPDGGRRRLIHQGREDPDGGHHREDEGGLREDRRGGHIRPEGVLGAGLDSSNL